MFKFSTMRFGVGAMLLLAFAAQAQITITRTDVLNLLGKTQVVRDDTTGSVTVNVGQSGASRTWDFRALAIRGNTLSAQYVTPQATPFAAQFPQANFVQKVAFTNNGAPGTAYLFSNVATNAWTEVGLAFVSDTTYFDALNELIAPLPAQNNASWNVVTADTIGDITSFAFINKTVSARTFDAWGTVRLTLGDFSCLRLRQIDTEYSQTYFGGMLLSNDSSKSVKYQWLTKEHGLVVSIDSQDGETNLNFTNASAVSVLQSTATAVEESPAHALPQAFALAQNYPNPFSRLQAASTALRFEITQPAFTELAIYTLQGEQVRVLAAQVLSPGAYTFRWDGRDQAGRELASGTYIYRLKTGALQTSRTLLLLK